MERKFKQIVAISPGDEYPHGYILFGLTEDGEVFEYNSVMNTKKWQKIEEYVEFPELES